MIRLARAVVVGLLLVVAGCSGGGEVTPTLAPGTTNDSATPTSSAPPPSSEVTTTSSATVAPTTTATTEVPSTTSPIPNTEGEDDFAVIWRELIEYHNWAFQNPDEADARIYLSEDCECFANAAAILDEYRTNGWREISEGLIVHDVDVDIETSTFALMTIVDEHSPLIVVDEDGTVVRERERRPKTFWDVRVRLLDEGWRIVEWFQRGAIGDAE